MKVFVEALKSSGTEAPEFELEVGREIDLEGGLAELSLLKKLERLLVKAGDDGIL